MANNATVTLTFKVQADGTLKQVTDNINKSAKATDNLGAAQNRAAKGADNHTRAVNGGIGSANNSARSMSKLLDTVGGSNSGLVAAYATLATNAFAVSAAFTALRDASQATLVLKGLEVQGARLGLTLTNTAQQVQALARGSLSAAEAMQATAQASATGFSPKNIEEITIAAQNASIALGRNMSDSMDRLIKGTSKLEPELLDELGIMVKLEESTAKYALATGKTANSLSSFERRQAFLNAVLEESRIKFGGLSDEVAADPYSKLAASFANLTKDTLNFLNNTAGVGSFVGFLADNTLALIGVIVIFAGTISRQLVPSLYEVSEATIRAKDAIAKKIEMQKKQISVTLQQAKAEREASRLSSVKGVDVEGSPEKVKAYVKALKEGNVVEGQREKALRSVTGAIAGNQAALNRITDTESAAYKNKSNLIAALRAQKLALDSLTTAELTHANVVSASQVKLDNIRKQSAGLRRQNNALTLSTNAIESAGQFELSKSYAQSKKSILLYNSGINTVAKSNVASAASSGTLARTIAFVGVASTGARTGLFALSLGVRALGAALLNAIPIIGQILFAVSLLWEGVKWLYEKTRPEGSELLDKALEDQEERYKSTAESAKELRRVGLDSSSAQIASLTIVGNKVKEIADGYDSIKAARDNLGKKSTVSEDVSAVLPKIIIPKEVQGTDVYKSLTNLRELGYQPLTDAIYKQVNASKILADTSTTLAQKEAVLEGIVKNLNIAFGSAQDAATRLKESFSDIDKAVEEFGKAALTATPVDALVASTTKASAAIYDLKAGLARGVIDAKDFGIQMSALSERAATLLPSSIQDNLSQFSTQYAKLSKDLEQINIKIAEQGGLEKASDETRGKRKQIESDIQGIATKTGIIVSNGLLNRQKELSELQNLLRTAQALNAAEKARYDKVARNLDDSKYAARLQDQVTEAQVARSVKALDIQIQLTKSLMYQAKLKEEATIKEIELNKKEYSEQKSRVEALIKSDKERTQKQIVGLNALKKASTYIFKIAAAAYTVLNDAVDSIAGKVNEAVTAVEAGFNNLTDKLKSFIMEDIKLEDTTVSIETQEAQNRLGELEARGYELQGVLVTLGVEVNNFQSSLDQLNASRVVELSKVLSESEKIARDLKYDTQLLNEFLGKRLEIENAIIAASTLSENLNKNLLNSFENQIRTKQRDLNIELRKLETQKEQERKTLQAQKTAKTLFLQQAGLDGLARKAAEFDLSVINARLSSIDLEKKTLSDIAQYKYSIQTVESATIDIYKEGLEIQQKSLEVVQKRLSLQQQLADQAMELESIQTATKAAETGIDPSEKAKKAAELRSAKVTLDVAKAQLEIKIQGIKLEYELLESQRLATINEYKLRKYILDLYVKQQLADAASKRAQGSQESIKAAIAIESSMSDMTTMMGQFGSSIQELQKYSFKDMVPMAIEVEKNAVRILEARYGQLMTEYNNIGRPTSSADIFRQAVNDIGTIINERRNRDVPILGTRTPTGEPVVSKDPSIEAAKSYTSATTLLTESITTHFPKLVENIEALDAIFSPLVGSLSNDLKNATNQSINTIGAITGRTNDTLKETMQIAMNMATQAGARSGEYGAQTGHRGRGHKEFRAIDVNMAAGDKESTDPAIRGKMDNLAEQYALKGYTVLWNKVRYSLSDSGEVIKSAIEKGALQHTDHMHVEATRAGVVMRDSIVQGGQEAAAVLHNAVAPASAVSAKQDINVVAEKFSSVTKDEDPTVDLDNLMKPLSSELLDSLNQFKLKFSEVWAFATASSKPLLDVLATLGPSGEAGMAAIQGVQSIGQAIISFSSQGSESFKDYEARMNTYNAKLAETGQKQVEVADQGEFAAQRMAQGFSMAAAVVGSVMSILKASSDAKLATIDKEISAEEKRDGKSAASVAKIAALEKKKDSIARKQFNTNKKLMMAQAVMATAAGIAGVLGDPSLPTIAKPIFAGIIGAMGLAQIAVIASTSYEGGASAAKSASMPTSLSIGKRSDTVDLARGPNANAGGEAGYLRGAQGTGSNASNFRTIGSAYGGELMRGYGNRGFVVGEKGPEVITPDTPITVTPANDVGQAQSINASFNIQALDSNGVQDILVAQKGNIIKMLREASNASGKSFMEDVNVNVYTRPSVGKL